MTRDIRTIRARLSYDYGFEFLFGNGLQLACDAFEK
ncbi:hypothetical protein NIES2134_122390 [Thermostichus vulcanus NIES-2134]|nr:hypothetical protein NIES2134_122390 [Thermostichus vulcanus NIES-2134]